MVNGRSRDVLGDQAVEKDIIQVIWSLTKNIQRLEMKSTLVMLLVKVRTCCK